METEQRSEPPHVGCYFLNGLLAYGLGVKPYGRVVTKPLLEFASEGRSSLGLVVQGLPDPGISNTGRWAAHLLQRLGKGALLVGSEFSSHRSDYFLSVARRDCVVGKGSCNGVFTPYRAPLESLRGQQA